MRILTSESWPATRPLAHQLGNAQSEPGSWFSTHACSPLCQIQMDAAQNLHPPPLLESEDPLSGTGWAGERVREREKKEEKNYYEI